MSILSKIGLPFSHNKDWRKRKVGNHVMYLDRKDTGISAGLMRLKKGVDREPAFMKVLRRELQKGMVAVDLGANIGYASLIMAGIVGPKGAVYAIEPSERNFMFLNMNIKANGYENIIHSTQMGISNKKGVQKFYISDKSNLHSMTPTAHTHDAVDVPVDTLSEFLKGKRNPNFIKMDIEGHEVEALEGMVDALDAAPPPVRILIEVHPMYYSEEHSFEKSLRLLLAIGFNTKYVISAGIGRPDFFVERGYEPDEVLRAGKRWQRGIYSTVSNEDMIQSACFEHHQYIPEHDITTPKIVRAIMIEKSI